MWHSVNPVVLAKRPLEESKQGQCSSVCNCNLKLGTLNSSAARAMANTSQPRKEDMLSSENPAVYKNRMRQTDCHKASQAPDMSQADTACNQVPSRESPLLNTFLERTPRKPSGHTPSYHSRPVT